jgi:Methionyl-tRNA synthetase
MSNLSINDAIEETLQFVRSINRYFEHKAPWKLVKEDMESAGTVLYTGAEALRICAILLSPIMPKRMKLLLSVLNAESSDRTWGNLDSGKILGQHKPLFPRINFENI